MSQLSQCWRERWATLFTVAVLVLVLVCCFIICHCYYDGSSLLMWLAVLALAILGVCAILLLFKGNRSRMVGAIGFILLLLGGLVSTIVFVPPTPTGAVTSNFWVDGFAVNEDAWTEVGSTPYLSSIDYSSNYVWDATTDAHYESWFTFADLSGSPAIYSVTLCVYAMNEAGDNGKIELYLYNSTDTYSVGYPQPSAGSWAWYNYTVTSTLPLYGEVNGAKLRLRGERIGGADNVFVDAALLRVEYSNPPETWYFTSTTHTVNGWTNEYNLSTTNTVSELTRQSGFVADPDNLVTVYVAVEVYVVFADEDEKRLTDGNYDDIQCSTTSTTKVELSDTWAYGSSISLNTTDAVGFKVYGKAGAGSWSLLERFITVQLGAVSLNSTTWTFYINMLKYRSQNPKTLAWEARAKLHFGSAGSDTRSANIEVNYADPMTFSDNGHNQTIAREPCEFSLKATKGDYNVSGYIFETNVTGVSRNDTWASSGNVAEAWLNVTKDHLHYTEGIYVVYAWYVNDTTDAWFSSDSYGLTTTEETTIYFLTVDGFTADYDEWTKSGTTPYLDDLGSNTIATSADDKQSGWFTFENLTLDRDSIIGNINLTLRYTAEDATGNKAFIVYWYNSNGTLNSHSYADSNGAWINSTVALNTRNNDWWSPYRLRDFKIRFKSDDTGGGSFSKTIIYAEIEVEAWSREHMLGWIWNGTVARQVNSSFPYVRGYNATSNEMENTSTPELLWGANLYKLMDNNTAFLEPAYEYADWLSSQPICRLWQTYDIIAQTWTGVGTNRIACATGANYLLAMSILANVNSSYNSLLQSAAQNFTDIWLELPAYMTKQNANTSGYTTEGSIYSSGHFRSAVAILYAGVVLENTTLKATGRTMALSYPVSPINIPYHRATLAGDPDSNDGSYSKEDETTGYYLLMLGMIHAYYTNQTIKNQINATAWSAAQYFWHSSNQRFVYKINATTGAHTVDSSVHGFGLLDEGLVQAYLIHSNTTWLTRARSDWDELVLEGHILRNDLICHSVTAANSIDFGSGSNDAWNSAAKRMGQIFHSLNVAGIYRNASYLDGYRKLYGSTSINHKENYGWVRVCNSSSLDPAQELPGDDLLISTSSIFRNFQVKNVTINTFVDLYNEFGNPFTGEEAGVTTPTTLSTDWNEVSPWAVDVDKNFGQVNASLNADGIDWTHFTIVWAGNGSERTFVYGYSWNAACEVESTSDVLWIWCNEAGSWYHNYS